MELQTKKFSKLKKAKTFKFNLQLTEPLMLNGGKTETNFKAFIIINMYKLNRKQMWQYYVLQNLIDIVREKIKRSQSNFLKQKYRFLK